MAVMTCRMLIVGVVALALMPTANVGASGRFAAPSHPLARARPPVDRMHPAGFGFSRDRNRASIPLWGYGGYGGYGYPADLPNYQPEYNVLIENGSESEDLMPRPIYRSEPRCRTDEQVVPSKRGGQVTIHVTRC